MDSILVTNRARRVFSSKVRLRIRKVATHGLDSAQRNGPIASNTTGFVPGMRVATLVFGSGLGADDEEWPCSVQREQALEVRVATIHNVEGAGLRDQQIKDIDVV